MILDALEIPNLSYEILEGSDRVGGRVYTHHFSNEKHDYYDVTFVQASTGMSCWLICGQGWCDAVPGNSDHEEVSDYDALSSESPAKQPLRTFNLFKHLGQKQVPLIPYWLTSPRGNEDNSNQPSRYNDKTVIGYKEGADVFQVSESFGGRIMKE